MMLSVRGVIARYGAIEALHGVDLDVGEGEIVTIIGANGAGKSTLLRTIMGLMKAAGGEITFMGERIDQVETEEIVRRGLVLVPEGRRVFPLQTVLDNLILGAYTRKGSNISQDLDRVFSLFPRLAERRKQPAGTLSGGEQQMLAVGRALMAAPKVLLLDEPSMGLAPILVKQIFATIRQVNESGTTVLLVEQNARSALRLASRAYVMETGRIVLSGSSSDLMSNELVTQSYLGEKRAPHSHAK